MPGPAGADISKQAHSGIGGNLQLQRALEKGHLLQGRQREFCPYPVPCLSADRPPTPLAEALPVFLEAHAHSFCVRVGWVRGCRRGAGALP